MAWGNPEALELEQHYVDIFNSENKDVQVKLFKVPGSAYLNKAIVMLASRTAPDVIRIDHYNFPSLVRKNYFMDMTPFAEADKGIKNFSSMLSKGLFKDINPFSVPDEGFNKDDFFKQPYEEGLYNGKLYGMNALFGGIIIYYNKSAVKECGLEDPYELSQKGKWTWEQFRLHAIAMTKKDSSGRYKRFGCSIPGYPMNSGIIWGFGGEVLSPDGTKCLLNSPGTVAAYQYLADLRWIDHCTPTPAQAANSAFTFEGGKIAMEFNWMGQSPRYRKVIQDFEWDICPIPSGVNGSVTCTKGNQLVIAANSKHPEAAWRYIRFLTSHKIEMDLLGKRRRSFPTRKSVAYSAEFLNATQPPFHTRVFVNAIVTGRPLPITDRWNEWTAAFYPEQDNLFSGRERSAKKAMDRATEQVNEVLADEEGF